MLGDSFCMSKVKQNSAPAERLAMFFQECENETCCVQSQGIKKNVTVIYYSAYPMPESQDLHLGFDCKRKNYSSLQLQ